MRVLVVGSGAIGLRTAVELARRKISVTLRSPVSPLHPSVTSVGAGGLWMPYHCDDVRTDRWALETLDELWSIAKQQQEPQNRLVEILPAIVLHSNNDHVTSQTKDTQVTYPDTSKLPAWTQDWRLEFQQLTVEMLAWQNTVRKLKIPTEQAFKQAGYWHMWMFQTPIVDSPKMLQALLDEVKEHPESNVDIETGECYGSLEEMQELATSLGCDTLINCTGMGSKQLFPQDPLIGARGVLLQLQRQGCPRHASLADMEHDAVIMADFPPWGTETEPCYVIPRGDIIAVGGTYLEGDGLTELRESERQRLQQNAKFLGIDIDNAVIQGEWTGFRPYRPVVRCEEDTSSTSKVRTIHSYGHGGSGWTVNVGAAKEVANILLSK